MKHYHIARLQLIGGVLYALAMISLLLHFAFCYFWRDFETTIPVFFVFLIIMLTLMSLNFAISLYVRWRIGADYASPHSPEGLPVDPTGYWIDEDTPLEEGSLVLALSQGRWHRAVVVELKSRDRVLVHFLGWDSFWDEIHYRTKLQCYPSEPLPPSAPQPTQPDTSIKK